MSKITEENPFGDWGEETAKLMGGIIDSPHIMQSICFIEMSNEQEFSSSISMGRATGFFARVGSKTVLVTNWHVLSGLHHTTRRWLNSEQKFFPDTITFYYSGLIGDGDRLTFNKNQFKLYRNKNGKKSPIWKVHGNVGSYWDIAVIDFTGIEIAKTFRTLEVQKLSAHKKLSLGEEMLVLGHPIDTYVTKYFPIMKRATVASLPALALDAHPKFLIDASTRGGMSGSPVLFHRPMLQQVFRAGNEKHSFNNCDFLGLYSGRVSGIEKKFSSDLGYVWRGDQVREVILDGTLDVLPVQGKEIPKATFGFGESAVDEKL